MTISQAQIDQLHTSAASALNSLNIAYGAQALAETLPLIGTGLGTSSSDATQVMENTRTALVNALSTLSGAATYTAAQVEIEINNALASIGMSGVVVGVQVSGSDITLSINAEAGETSQFAVAGDIGLPGIAVSVAGSADVAANAALSLTMGLDSSGFFIDTAASGIDLSLGTTGVTFNASASLGVLQYVVADAGTELDLEFAIDLTDANNDGLLRLSEMGQDFLDVSLNGQADIGLAMAADFGTGALPSVSAVLEIDWQFINADVNPTDQNVTFGELPSVVLKDVTLDLGSFLENVMLPIFDAIAPLIDPINTALEVITADITMLKLLPNWETLLDLSGDGEINMLDLLKLADPDIDLGPIEDFIDLAKDIVDWAEFLDSVAVGEAGLNFGDFNLDTAEDLRDLAFDITTANLDLQGAADTLTDVVDALSGGEWTNSSGGTSPQEMLQEMVSGTAFSVPILEDPAQILSLLFGGEADLVEIDFPEVSMSAGGDSLLTIPVFTGITVNIGGSISAAFDLAFGYSTRGLTMPGASALTALNGLYVIDGEGPEASLSATINLGAALDAVIASLYGGGAVTGTIELDIADGLQSQPGRLYYDEFLAALSTNPFSLFDASGSITAHLTLAARVLGGDIFRIDSPQITLADFNFTGVSGLASSTSTLALASLSGGVLTLNTGPLAGNRLVGSAVDGNEIAYVSDATGGKVNVVIDGYAEAYTSGTQIAADLGQGNDQLVLSETLAIAGSIEGGEGRDILAGGAAGDTLDGGIGEDTLFGRDGNDSLIGGDGADLFYGGAGADTLSGGDGEDMVSYVYSGVGVNVNLGTGTGAGGTAQGDVLTSIEVLQGSNDADTLTGSGNGEMIIGLDGDDSIAGAGGDDVLLGSDGNDTLDGGTGADTMVGAQGDDLYFVDDTGDVVDENRYGEIPVGTDGGTDEVRAAISWSIATGTQSQIENLTLIGTAISGTGNAGDNVITANQLGLSGGSLYGGGGSDTLHGSGAGEWLDGQAGADSMIGHGGNDTYFVDHLGDDIVEAALEGTDTAISRLQSFALDADDDIEVMALDASVLNGSLTGNALDQSLIGASGNDTLEGLGGADALIGGTGRDRATYRSSTVAVSIDLTLAAQIGGDAAGDTYTSIEEIEGSALADTLIGDDGDNAFLGLGGDDTLRGALGNDTLLGGSGHDSLDGGIGADYLDGDAGNDSLDGGQDADTLIGGNGDDTYVVDHILEQVTELGTGTDLVQAWVDWSLDAPSQLNIENLTLLGAARIGTGNALANTLIGTAGNDRLDGLLGRDTMIGGVGDDTYVVDNVLDLITDTSGHDLIEVRAAGASSFDMSVQAADIEDLTVADTSGAVRITGNDLDNVITGNASGDTISGGMGNDTIIAGGGGSEVLSGDEGDDDLRLTLLSRGTHYVYGGEGAADIMRMDWSTSASAITHFSNSSASYYRTYVDGYVYTYFDGIESFDLRGGSASDVLYGGNLADTLVGNGGSDRLYGYRGALEVSGGAGHDLVYATIRTAEDVDLGLDFSLRLLDTQTGPVIVNAGTAVETSWEGIEQVRITTGAGNDLLDTRNVSSSSNVFGVSNYWNSGDGDDHYLTDLGALGSANFLAGDGIDTLTIDWGDATSGITYYSNSSATYYRVYVEGFGYVYQYFSDIEKIDFTTGSASDIVYAVGGRDRFVTNGGQDRIFGADKGDTVLAGDGNDWVSLDLR
ncbi:beta strand repeat-containing protein, partial [Pelagimonas varians]